MGIRGPADPRLPQSRENQTSTDNKVLKAAPPRSPVLTWDWNLERAKSP